MYTLCAHMRKVRDHYTKKAREDRYRARSVYKLMEMDRKYQLIRTGMAVLDIGCAPGSWSQYALEKVGKGYVTGIDLAPSVSLGDSRFNYMQADILNQDIVSSFSGGGSKQPLFDLILSDAAPKTTGSKFSDSQNSLRLVRTVFELSGTFLKNGGAVCAKVFQGEDLKTFVDSLRKGFARVDLFKPKSSRAESRELYIIARKWGGHT